MVSASQPVPELGRWSWGLGQLMVWVKTHTHTFAFNIRWKENEGKWPPRGKKRCSQKRWNAANRVCVEGRSQWWLPGLVWSHANTCIEHWEAGAGSAQGVLPQTQLVGVLCSWCSLGSPSLIVCWRLLGLLRFASVAVVLTGHTLSSASLSFSYEVSIKQVYLYAFMLGNCTSKIHTHTGTHTHYKSQLHRWLL